MLDNAPGHPQHIDDLLQDVKVLYLPKNTTAILQPMDQGCIATFKVHYLRTFSKAIAETESGEVTLRDFRKNYNIPALHQEHCISVDRKFYARHMEKMPETFSHLKQTSRSMVLRRFTHICHIYIYIIVPIGM